MSKGAAKNERKIQKKIIKILKANQREKLWKLSTKVGTLEKLVGNTYKTDQERQKKRTN